MPGRRLAVGRQGVDVALVQGSRRPTGRTRSTTGDPVAEELVAAEVGQPVGQEAGADDEDALVTQRHGAAARGRAAGPDRGSGCSAAAPARRPSGYITFSGTQAPWSRPRVGSLVERLAVGSTAGHLAGQGAGVGGRVGPWCSSAGREPAEVVDRGCAGGPGRRQTQRGGLPVGAHHEDGGGRGQCPAPGEQLVDPERVVEEGRGAVAEEEGRHRPVVRAPGRRPGRGGGRVPGGTRRRPHPVGPSAWVRSWWPLLRSGRSARPPNGSFEGTRIRHIVVSATKSLGGGAVAPGHGPGPVARIRPGATRGPPPSGETRTTGTVRWPEDGGESHRRVPR